MNTHKSFLNARGLELLEIYDDLSSRYPDAREIDDDNILDCVHDTDHLAFYLHGYLGDPESYIDPLKDWAETYAAHDKTLSQRILNLTK